MVKRDDIITDEATGEMYTSDTHEVVIYSDYQGEYILQSEAHDTLCDGYVDSDTLEADFYWCEHDEVYEHEDYAQHSTLGNCWYDRHANIIDDFCGDDSGTPEEFDDDDRYNYVSTGSARGRYVWYERCVWAYDIDEYVLEDDADYCDEDDEWYYDATEMPTETGDRICSYHRSPAPRVLFPECGERFYCGIEVEKNYFEVDGNRVDEIGETVLSTDLFKGYETDVSCGFEAITNILPLGPIDSDAEAKVFQLFDYAAEVINSPYDRRCGGHITVSWNRGGKGNVNGSELNELLKPYYSLLYAMYRFRLKNTHCRHNLKAKPQYNEKYSPINIKHYTIEFRLFSAVANVRQLKSRYRLMYAFLHFALNKKNNYAQFLNNMMPYLLEVYRFNEEKVNKVLNLSWDFRDYVMSDVKEDSIDEFIIEAAQRS